jgi:hypothetical protein
MDDVDDDGADNDDADDDDAIQPGDTDRYTHPHTSTPVHTHPCTSVLIRTHIHPSQSTAIPIYLAT